MIVHWRVLASLLLGVVIGCGSDPSAMGGAASLSIGGATNSNVATKIPPITWVLGSEGRAVGALSFEHPPSSGMKLWQLLVVFASAPQSGQTFTIAPRQAVAGTGAIATMEMEEQTASGDFRGWSATSGSIAVPTRVGDQVTLTFEGVPFQPAQQGSGEAMGMFTLSGRIRVDDINQMLPKD